MKSRFVIPLLFLALTLVAHAQFYAPPTEFHDPAQRTFPVEAARVLAWQQNARGTRIAEITFRAETTAERETRWIIQWMDAEGKAVREKSVGYPESAMLEGPTYYRRVFRELSGDDWKLAGTGGELGAAFWKGGDDAGVSRPEAIVAAGKLLAQKPHIDTAADAAQLAGILAHGALPSFGHTLTLDAVLLSRAAAWLCTAEALSGRETESEWAPILFLAGREYAASALWKKAAPAVMEKAARAQRFWDFFLREPSPSESFLFAARRENRQFAMPAMMYHSASESHWGKITVEIGEEVLGDAVAARHFEYGPAISARGGVAGGHVGGSTVVPAIRAWVDVLRAFTPAPQDFTGYREPLAKALAEAAQAGNANNIESQLQRLAPLLNLAFEESSHGALTPVAHATSRDILGYGWESAGLQLGYFHKFLRSLGDPEGAKSVGRPALWLLQGVDPFFSLRSKTEFIVRYPLRDLARVQFVDAEMVDDALLAQLPESFQATPDGWVRRTWLNKGGGNAPFEAMVRAGATDAEVGAMVERVMREGGQTAFSELAVRDRSRKLSATINQLGLRGAIAAALRSRVSVQSDEIEAARQLPRDNFRDAQNLERAGWQSGFAGPYTKVFERYLEANAVKSAKRYYDQIKPFIAEQVVFSNTLGPERFALAWLENDDAMMQQALRDCSTYSYSDLRLQISYAISRGNADEARQIIDALIERYGDRDGQAQRLREWLALLPALLDLQHPDHSKALDTFPADRDWKLIQWILLRNAKLPVDEAARFLGGENADETSQLMIAGLRGDKALFNKVYRPSFKDVPSHARVVILRLRADLFRIRPPAQEPDLKPPGLKPLVQLVHDEVEKGIQAEVAKASDLTAFKTADELWAHLQTLEASVEPRDASREAYLVAWRAGTAVAEAFTKQYPKDPRRWDARVLTIRRRMQTARAAGQLDAERGSNRTELEAILSAPDASEPAKGEAAFLQLTLDAAEVDSQNAETLPAFLAKAEAFLTAHANHPRATDVASGLMQLLETSDLPEAATFLETLAASPIPTVARKARELINQRGQK